MLVAAMLLLLCAGQSSAADLLAVYRSALDNDPQLRQAQKSRQAVVEARKQARSNLLPQLSFSADVTRNTRDQVFDSTQFGSFGGVQRFNSHGYSLALTQPIYRHENYVGLRQASAAIHQADAELSAAEQALMVRIAERYFDVLAALDDLAFAQAELRALERQLEQTRQRFEVGLIAITDVHEAQARHDLTVARKIAAQNQVSDSREALREFTAGDVSELSLLMAKTPLVTPEPADVEQWVASALEHNPQLVAVRHANEVLRHAVELQRAGHYPSLDFVASRSRAVSGGGSFGGSEIDSTTLALQLNVPIYQGGVVSSRTREALLRYEQNREVLEQQRRAVLRQAREAYRGVVASISQVTALEQAVISSRSAMEAIEVGLEVGTRTTVDLLQARQALFLAQRDYARARYDYILNTLRLKQAAGLLSVDDLMQISRWLQR
ncbi:MAG: TolC family outer membrane protein [Gammaproteobacteria bacterium]|nr:TolC family outer membrane protein [Gammaproteobacteria bacterium]